MGKHGAKGLCPKHYAKTRITVRRCPQCGETKKFYNSSKTCQACKWYERKHLTKRNAPKRIRDGVKTLHHEEYSIYRGMLKRCYGLNDPKYKNYGGRGVKVCNQWRGAYGFHNFYKDMGPRPGKEYSIDRIDVNGDYCPENCRWATIWEQASNKTTQRMYSKQVGVTFNKSIGLWTATLQEHGVKHVEYAKTEPEAVALRLNMEKQFLN